MSATDRSRPREPLTARAARWSAAHRRLAVFGWLAFVATTFAIGSAVGTVTMRSDEFSNGESGRADRVLARQFPSSRALEQVLIERRQGRLGGAEYRIVVGELVRRLSRIPVVGGIASPLDPRRTGLVSADGRAALVTFWIKGDPDTAADRVGPALAAAAAVQKAHPGLYIGEVGDASANEAIMDRVESDFQKAEVTALPVTLIILVLAFGSLVAAGIPLLVGATAVGAALGLTALFSHLLHVDSVISSVILLVGLAVGVDYSLFYLRRAREERHRGRTSQDALLTAAATSGRAVLISGLTVMIAMTGMFFMGSQVFTSFGVGTVLVVAIAVVGSLTVLPAILAALGDRVDAGRVPFVARLRTREGESRLWRRIVGAVVRRPAVSFAVAAGFLVALAVPALTLHTVNSGVQGLPRDMPVMKVYDRIQNAFPGGPVPAVVVVSARDVTSPAVARGIAALQRAALDTGQMHEPISVDISTSHEAARIQVPLAGGGTDGASNRALLALRDQVIPRTVGAVPGVSVATTGMTASSRDFNQSMKAHAPIVFVYVLGLAFLLLLITFRSLVIAATAIVLNMLSVAASYGLLVVVFQQGHLESLIRFRSTGGVTSWLPLFLFVILFGLSMDYHVLILSRIREYRLSGLPTGEAVARGISATASVVTAAAFVMVAVFAIFATLGMIDFKMMGVGLAAAVLIDATIVRAVLLPATMTLLGDWNWYLPRWLDWLPRLERGGGGGPTTRPPAAPPAHAR